MEGYFGVGGSATFVSERFRGERYDATNGWLYASVTTREVLTSYQILMGFVNEGRLSLDHRYKLFPQKAPQVFQT